MSPPIGISKISKMIPFSSQLPTVGIFASYRPNGGTGVRTRLSTRFGVTTKNSCGLDQRSSGYKFCRIVSAERYQHWWSSDKRTETFGCGKMGAAASYEIFDNPKTKLIDKRTVCRKLSAFSRTHQRVWCSFRSEPMCAAAILV